MRVQPVRQLGGLLPYRERWDQLAGECVFRRWDWLTTWWEHYGSRQPAQELAVLLVLEDLPNDSEHLLAILPCYVDYSLTRGKVLRLLGDGEVCSDHLDLLVAPVDAPRAAKALAEYLVTNGDDWDLMDLSAIDAGEVALEHLCTAFESHACQVSRIAGPSCWSVELPESWEDFLAGQSKSHRKRLRRLKKYVFDTGQGVWHLVQTRQELDIAWPILIDLHQRRRNSLGEPGCFTSSRWANFHRDIAEQLLSGGRLRLSWLEMDGQPVAAEYQFADGRTTFAYQAGIDPDRLEQGPGRLSMMCVLQHAIAEGHTSVDLLRGDEPYKANWRATPRPTHALQIVPARNAARWRFQAWNCLRGAGRFAREFAKS